MTIAEETELLVATRRDLHRHPEIAFGEHRTAGIAASAVEALGFRVRRGVGGRGVEVAGHARVGGERGAAEIDDHGPARQEVRALLLGLSLIVSALLWPLIKAIATRIGGGSVSAALETEVEALRERVRQLEEMPPRMAELEERVDFTERIVAQGREPDRLQR